MNSTNVTINLADNREQYATLEHETAHTVLWPFRVIGIWHQRRPIDICMLVLFSLSSLYFMAFWAVLNTLVLGKSFLLESLLPLILMLICMVICVRHLANHFLQKNNGVMWLLHHNRFEFRVCFAMSAVLMFIVLLITMVESLRDNYLYENFKNTFQVSSSISTFLVFLAMYSNFAMFYLTALAISLLFACSWALRIRLIRLTNLLCVKNVDGFEIFLFDEGGGKRQRDQDVAKLATNCENEDAPDESDDAVGSYVFPQEGQPLLHRTNDLMEDLKRRTSVFEDEKNSDVIGEAEHSEASTLLQFRARRFLQLLSRLDHYGSRALSSAVLFMLPSLSFFFADFLVTWIEVLRTGSSSRTYLPIMEDLVIIVLHVIPCCWATYENERMQAFVKSWYIRVLAHNLSASDPVQARHVTLASNILAAVQNSTARARLLGIEIHFSSLVSMLSAVFFVTVWRLVLK